MVKQAEQRYKPPPAHDHDTAPVMGYPAVGPYPRRLPAVVERKHQHYPPEYHPRYGQPAALNQQAPSLKLWPEGPFRSGPESGGPAECIGPPMCGG